MSTDDAAILVVDDNENNRYTLVRRLNREGYTNVDTANDGRAALSAIAERKFDLVLLDIMMPELNGYEVLEQLREQDMLQDLPVIVISAIDELDSVVKCIELGAEDYLAKPFNPVLLKARISAVLEKKRLRDEMLRQLALIRSVFGKYVPEQVASAVLAGEGHLEPAHAEATILYTDIEGFTSIAESMSPEHVVAMLNDYFPTVIEPIQQVGGVVNQFQGDAMLVTFNVPVADPAHAEHAIEAAIAIQLALKGRLFEGVALNTRIGINTGQVIAGNVGSGDRLNYTVHGDAVNLAARLEQLNKEYGSRILVSEFTHDLVAGRFDMHAVGSVQVRGKSQPVRVFQVDA